MMEAQEWLVGECTLQFVLLFLGAFLSFSESTCVHNNNKKTHYHTEAYS